jgi:hypothetical protein
MPRHACMPRHHPISMHTRHQQLALHIFARRTNANRMDCSDKGVATARLLAPAQAACVLRTALCFIVLTKYH